MAVSISFVLAVTLWFLVTLNSQTYTSPITYPVKLTNLPDKYQLESEIPTEVEVLTEGQGIKLFYEVFNSRRDTIKIDFARFGTLNYFLAHENSRVINSVLPAGLRSIQVTPDSIPLSYAAKSSKRVPIQLNAKIEAASTFRFISPITFQPDSILVFGPKVLLDTLQYWPTKQFEALDLKAPTNLYIPLDTIKPFEIFQKDIMVSVKPEPFTENRATVRIEARNLPPGTNLRLMPDTVSITYLVPVNKYGRYHPRDFRVRVDFDKIRSYQKSVFPEIVEMPDKIEVVKMEPVKIKFMIEKERED